MQRNALIAVALVAACSCCAFGIVGAAFFARTPSAPAPTVAAVAPPPVIPPPALPPPAPPPLTPLEQVALRAHGDLARLGALDDDAYSAELEAWGRVGEPSYESLQRNAGARFGERAVYDGRIEEIHDTPGGGSQIRLSIGRGRVLWVQAVERPHADFVTGRRARVFGYVVGDVTYRSQAGWDITLPAIVAIAVHSR